MGNSRSDFTAWTGQITDGVDVWGFLADCTLPSLSSCPRPARNTICFGKSAGTSNAFRQAALSVFAMGRVVTRSTPFTHEIIRGFALDTVVAAACVFCFLTSFAARKVLGSRGLLVEI
jgi:hypothetical protein